MLKIDACLSHVNREKISICYNECYKAKHPRRMDMQEILKCLLRLLVQKLQEELTAVEIFVDRFRAIIYMKFLINIVKVLPNGSMTYIQAIGYLLI